MACEEESLNNIVKLQKQLSLARDEINNLRKELKSFRYSQKKEINDLKLSLASWKCSKCRESDDQPSNGIKDSALTLPDHEMEASLQLRPIGVITTGFSKKRAVPRQPNVNLSCHGKITLFNHTFTNPEHSLEGLDEFSHMWILFHFHKNESTHVRAKVAPPRLNGTRVGVFGTRSPHRPCPIGLSLVQIDHVEGPCVYFSGVDTLDGTPVLDLKPYIPHYDNPTQLNIGSERLALEGQESDTTSSGLQTVSPVRQLGAESLLRPVIETEREAPDGEETLETISPQLRSLSPLPPLRHVRVPEWISQPPNSQLLVTFSPQAENQLTSLRTEEDLARIIRDILQEDPRSVYLRDRYANQFYTFLINNFHVSCKFDDHNRSVRVYRVLAAETLCDCGQPQWQCDIHSATNT